MRRLIEASREFALEDSMTGHFAYQKAQPLLDQIERRLAKDLPACRGRFHKLSWVAVLALLGALAAAAWGPWFMPWTDPWQRASVLEQRALRSPVLRQNFALLIRPQGSSSETRTRVELAYDQPRKRFVAYWRNEDHSLLYGLWHPSPGQTYVYNSREQMGVRPRRAASPSTIIPLTSLAARDGEAIGRAIAGWLESRGLTPIRLTRECLLMPELPSIAHSTRHQAQDGSWVFRWQNASENVQRAVILTINGTDFMPRGQTLTIAAGDSRTEIRLELLDQQILSSDNLSDQSFQPSPLLTMARSLIPGSARFDELLMNLCYVCRESARSLL
jgi:hypothetical protein